VYQIKKVKGGWVILRDGYAINNGHVYDKEPVGLCDLLNRLYGGIDGKKQIK